MATKADLEYENSALLEQVERLTWAVEDTAALVDAVRRTHDGEHSTAWAWCDVQACRLVREHELD